MKSFNFIFPLSLWVIWAGFQPSFGQENLVPNPSFEEYIKLPSNESDFHLVKEWLSPASLNREKKGYPDATVDYLHKRGTGAAKLPASYYGTVEPFDGEAVAHFTVTNGSADFREYLSVRLRSAPQVGKTYHVSFYLSNGESNHYGSNESKDVHVLFTDKFPKQSRAESLSGYDPQLKMDKMLFTKTWEKISFTYVPTEPNLDVLVIGNFYPPSKTVLGRKIEGRYTDSDFFIDMVTVALADGKTVVDVKPTPKFITLVVTALDKKTSKPLVSAKIALAAAEAEDFVETTNSEGKAIFKMPFAQYLSLTAKAPHYQDFFEELTLDESKAQVEHTVYLEKNPPKGTSVSIQVLDEATKTPLLNSMVTLKPSSAERVRSTPTLSNGAHFSLPLWTEFEVNIDKEGYHPISQKAIAIEGSNPDSLYYSFTAALKKKQINLLIKGTLKDHKTKSALAGEVEISFSGKKESLKVSPDGKFELVLPYQASISYFAKAKGYLQDEDTKQIEASTSDIELNLSIELEKLEIGKIVALKNVLFVQGQPTLLAESYPELDKLLDLLQENPDIKIEMAGHTDNLGNPVKNQQLSEARVNKIKDYLVGKGIAENRVYGKGYGGSKPLYEGPDMSKRAQNRRVEFKIIE
jgi:outer membrane protein OmpA-like peptidoglycan-associated protein